MARPERPLEREFAYFIEHQDELAKKYQGKVIVIVGDEVVGAFETELDAVRKMSEVHEPGTFLVQRCERGSECYTATYYGFHVAFDPMKAA